MRTGRNLSFISDKVALAGDGISCLIEKIVRTVNSGLSGLPLSRVVRQAMDKGLSEPDPRDDLSGMDVARKLLILARETGLKMELDEVQIKSFLPDACFEATSVETFFVQLEKEDGRFEERRKKAERAGKVLRYTACLECGTARIGLEEVDAAHPFSTLQGSDNMIFFPRGSMNRRGERDV